MDDQRADREGGGVIEFDDNDLESIDRFKSLIRAMGAKLKSQDYYTVVGDIYGFIVGEESLTVVSDAWSGTVRAFASVELIARIQDAMKFGHSES